MPKPESITMTMARTRPTQVDSGCGRTRPADLARGCYPLDVILLFVRWYVAYSLSLHDLEEMMAERGIQVDTFHCASLGDQVAAGVREGLSPTAAAGGQQLPHGRDLHPHQRPVDVFLPSRGQVARPSTFCRGHVVTRLLRDASSRSPSPRTGRRRPSRLTRVARNLAALQALNAKRETHIKIRQNKHLNNLVVQDHRSIKRRIRPMLGFQNFRCASSAASRPCA